MFAGLHLHQNQAATLIQAGTIQLSPPDSGTALSPAIQFGTAYGSTPEVFVQVTGPSSSANPRGSFDFTAADVTGAGFRIAEGPWSHDALPAGGVTVQWEAVGTP